MPNFRTKPVASSYLIIETKGPQEGIQIIKFCIAKALEPLWVTGLSRQPHCTDLGIKHDRITYETNKVALYSSPQ